MLNLQILEAAAPTTGAPDSGSIWSMILIYAVLFGGLYLVMFRPNSKRRKQEAEMRNNVEIGDQITTIGGIVGKVVGIKDDEDDAIIIESSFDRTKLKIKRWAIASIDNEKPEAKAAAKPEKKSFFKKNTEKSDKE